MRFVYGDVSAEIPDGWTDCSSILFVRPTDETEAGAPTFTLTSVRSAEPAQRVTTEHVARLKGLCVGMRVLESGPFRCGLGEGWQHVLLLPSGNGAACQLVVGVNRPGKVVLATAAAPEAVFPRWRDELTAMLASLSSAVALGSR